MAFLGCGFITRVHSRHLKALRARDPLRITPAATGRRPKTYCRRFRGTDSYADYATAIDDPRVDAVVVAVPPRYHLELTLRALAAGKHVLVEKPAFLTIEDYHTVIEARNRAGRVVLVGENDHYKPLAVRLRQLLATGLIGEMVFAHFTTVAKRLKTADDWRNDEAMAGGDAFFEEGHPLAAPGRQPWVRRSRRAHGYRPSVSASSGPDRRAKSMMVAFRYDNDAVGSLYYSREIPSLLQGLRLSKLFGRDGIISFESNGLFILARGRGLPRADHRRAFATSAATRRCIAISRRSIRERRVPEMSLERAIDDQRLMDQIYASVGARH